MNFPKYLVTPTLSLISIFGLAPMALCTDYYVSASGNDSNSGLSSSSAWKSIAKVNSRTFAPGDRILFQGGGTFPGRIYFGPGTGGTATNAITLTSYGTGKAIIDGGTGAGAFFAWNTAGIDLSNLIFKGSSFGANLSNATGVLFYIDLAGNVVLPRIHLNSIEVYGFGAASVGGTDPNGFPIRKGGEGISVGGWNGLSGFSDIQITNSVIHDNEGTGIILWGPEIAVHKNLYIGNIEVYRNTGRTTSPSNTQFSGAGTVIYNTSGGVVEHSSFHDNGANGNGTAGLMIMESDHITAQYNQAYHNRTGGDADGDGFDVDGGSTDCIVQNNFSYGNDGAGYLFAQPPGVVAQARNVLRYNISENDGGKWKYGSIHFWNGGPGIDNLDLYNNTIYSNPLQGGTTNLISFSGSAATNVRFRNNIFMTTAAGNIMAAPSGSSSIVFQYNDYWTGGGPLNINWAGVTYANLDSWSSATGQESSLKLSANPSLTSPGGGVDGYKLLNGSPMIDKGTAVALPTGFVYAAATQDYYGYPVPAGMSYDIGANEFATYSLPVPPVITSFTANPSSIAAGGSSFLSWNTSNAASLTISPNVGTVAPAGSVNVMPYETTSYTLMASGSGGTVTGSVTISVAPKKDTTAPVVSIISPADGSTITGLVTISAIATDNAGVAGVQFQIDGITFGPEITNGSYTVSWDSGTVPNGTHMISAVARDAAGNRSTASVRVKVRQAKSR